MTIYYCIYALFGLTSVWCSSFVIKEQNARRGTCFIAFMSLFLLLGLRHPSMGIDLRYLFSYGYLGQFEAISKMSWTEAFNNKVANYENGYIVFNKVVSIFTKDRQVFMGICAFLSILPIIFLIYKKSASVMQSFIIYMGLPIFLISYSALRQALAVGLCALAMLFIEDKKIFKFVALVLLAYTFHSSAIIFLAAYPIYHLKLNLTWRWVSVVGIFVVFVLRQPLFSILSKIFKDNATADNNGAITLFLVFTLVYIFCIIYSNHGPEQSGLMNLFLMACICQAFGGVYNIAMRVAYYFMLPLALLLPSILKDFDDRTDKPIFSIVITGCFVFFGLYSIYNSTWEMAYPYYFYWEAV